MEQVYKKIKTLKKLTAEINELKRNGKSIVQSHGVFDLIHPGHIRHLVSAKSEGDILVVTVTADKYVKKGPGRPIFNQDLRAETLAAMSAVDYVAINHAPTATNCIKIIKPDVYVKGQDYIDRSKDITGKINEEESAVVSVGGKIVFTNDITFSSSNLINEYMQVFKPSTRKYLNDMSSKYPVEYIFEVLDSLKKLKVLVIGETIIDQYHYCEGMDKSRKSNVIDYKYKSEESFAGGALAVANHISGLSDNVSLFTITGNEKPYNDFLAKSIKPNIQLLNFIRKDSPTIVKRRFINSGQKLFEICYLNDSVISRELETKINAKLKEIISDFDLVIVADFGHGFLEKNLIKTICKGSNFLAVNTQTNGANMGFNLITQYSNIGYAVLDELEIRYAAHDRFGQIEDVAKKVARKIGCGSLIVTRGNNGALSLTSRSKIINAPALATNIIDAIGAGDAFFAFTASLVAKGLPPDLILFIGNAVGALAVQIVCNREPVDPVYLKKFIATILK